MKINPITATIISAVLIGWGVLIFQSDDRPEILAAMIGCFEEPNTLPPRYIRISGSGQFITQAGVTTVSGYKDKVGSSLLPKEEVVIESGAVALKSGQPLFLRISSDRRSFLIPDEEGADVRFERIPCAKLPPAGA